MVKKLFMKKNIYTCRAAVLIIICIIFQHSAYSQVNLITERQKNEGPLFFNSQQADNKFLNTELLFTPDGNEVYSLSDTSFKQTTEYKNKKYLKNNIKFNISALAFNNYAFFYERSLTPKISVSVGYRFMPVTTMSNTPLAKQLSKILDTNGDENFDIQSELEKLKLSGNAITPEFRFYLGKKKGARGFYFSFYGRYATYKVDYNTEYTAADDVKYNLPIIGDAKSISGGIGSGFQILIAKRVILDIYMVGTHFGKVTGNASALTDLSGMTDADQAELKESIESIAFNGKSWFTADVSDNGVKIKIDGPFLGIRALGISLGIAF
jgi:hypothetical protein